jgi:hypothetical protein
MALMLSMISLMLSRNRTAAPATKILDRMGHLPEAVTDGQQTVLQKPPVCCRCSESWETTGAVSTFSPCLGP